MSDAAGKGAAASAGAASENASSSSPPAHAPSPSSAVPVPFVDGLGPVLLGAVWLVGAKIAAFTLVLFSLSLAGSGAILLIEETRSVVMSEAGAAVLLFAGLARAAAPWAAGREGLMWRPLGRAAFALLLLAFSLWILLSLSFLIPGLWPSPFDPAARAAGPGIPDAVYWLDFGIVCGFYAAMIGFGVQILVTLTMGLWAGGRRVGPAAVAFAIAALLAVFALPGAVQDGWLGLTSPPPAAEAGEATGLAAKAYAREDGRYYVFDQIKLTVLDFVVIAAAFGVLSIAVWRGAGGVLRWSWPSSLGLIVFGLGAWFTLAGIGLMSPVGMARALTTATILCAAALLTLPASWARTLLAKGARRGAPALWALAALLPTSAAIVAVPWLSLHLELAEDGFDFWIAAFDSLDVMLLLFAAFAGWYALQHRLTGRETGRFWSVAHLLVAFLISAGAAFGAFYNVYFESAFGAAAANLPEEARTPTFFALILAEYALFLFGLALARRRSVSRFEPAGSAAHGAASRAASAAKPKESFKKTTLFGGEDKKAAEEPPKTSEQAAPKTDDKTDDKAAGETAVEQTAAAVSAEGNAEKAAPPAEALNAEASQEAQAQEAQAQEAPAQEDAATPEEAEIVGEGGDDNSAEQKPGE